MDIQNCKEFIESMPFASALALITTAGGCELIESNHAFDIKFGIKEENTSDILKILQKNDTALSKCLIQGIHEKIKGDKNYFASEQSGSIISLKILRSGKHRYLMIFILGISKDKSSAVRNYESFYNAIDDMFIVAKQDGTILFSNKAVTSKLGYTKNELIRMHILALHPEEKRKEAEEIFTEMFQNKRDVCPLPLQKKNGQYLPVETRIWLGDWDGEQRLFGIIRDLSTEQAALQKFTKLFDRNPASMAITSLSTGCYTQVNKAFINNFGFSEDEIIGKTAIELGIFIDTESFIHTRNDLISNGYINEKVIKVRKKTGEIMVGLFSGEIIESQTEKFIMTIMVNLTDQYEIEQKLEKKSNLQAILIGLSSRYINCSLENVEREIQTSLELVGRFVGADRVYIFDYDFDAGTTSNTFEWCNNSIEPQIDLLQSIPLSAISDWVAQHIKGEPVIIQDVSELDAHDSAVKEILESQDIKSLITIPMMFEAECFGYVGFDAVIEKHTYSESEIDLLKFYAQILANIHLRKIHEQDIQAARVKAETANRAKNYFIAKTSHELRNPLNGAWGFMNLLDDLISDRTSKEYLANSIQSLGDTIRILNDLIDISKIETNELILHDDRIEIFKLMNESINPYRSEMQQKKIQLDIKLNSDLPEIIIGDFNRLKQIIGNLVLNAISHAQTKAIELGCIPRRTAKNSHELLFYVKDSGIGIEKDIQSKVFDLFYKKESGSPGSGLGLPICKDLVSLMGGNIWVVSNIGEGTSFFFTIPYCVGNEVGEVKLHNNKEDTKDVDGLRVLLAEDNVINQTLVIEMLRRVGIAVSAVQNGAEALDALEKDNYDLILMDIQMPIMDGLEAIKRIRELKNQTPIIALTGSVLSQEKQMYMSRGANEVVEKPIFFETLLEKIRSVLSQTFIS